MKHQVSAIRPGGWYAPVCVPLTQRTMFVGVPFDHLMWLMTMGMIMAIWGLYIPAVVFPLVLWRLLRALVTRDEWALGQSVEYLRVVVGRLERLRA